MPWPTIKTRRREEGEEKDEEAKIREENFHTYACIRK